MYRYIPPEFVSADAICGRGKSDGFLIIKFSP
jgi:hypothetical protein